MMLFSWDYWQNANSGSDGDSSCSSRRRTTMTRSKQLEEHGEFKKLEKSPSMDDTCNHLEVIEYVAQIYQYCWVTKLQA